MNKLFAALTALTLSTSALASGQLSMSTGFDYSSGTYGNATATNILYIPVNAIYETDALTLKVTLPYLFITGPGGVVQGMGRMGPAISPATGRNTTTATTTTTNSGLGDITASAGYNFYAQGPLALDVVGKIKLGTADSTKGLGTGQNDYAAQIDGYFTQDKSTLFATAGYKIYGAPAGVTMKNAPYGTLGLSQKLSNVISAGIMLDVAQSPSTTSAGRREVTLYATKKLSPTLKVQANVLKGFSSGSPDFGGGLTVTGMF